MANDHAAVSPASPSTAPPFGPTEALLARIDRAQKRASLLRTPPHQDDPDIVLADARREIEALRRESAAYRALLEAKSTDADLERILAETQKANDEVFAACDRAGRAIGEKFVDFIDRLANQRDEAIATLPHLGTRCANALIHVVKLARYGKAAAGSPPEETFGAIAAVEALLGKHLAPNPAPPDEMAHPLDRDPLHRARVQFARQGFMQDSTRNAALDDLCRRALAQDEAARKAVGMLESLTSVLAQGGPK